MGWNSWNTFKQNINQTLVEDTAKAMVEKRLARVGYTYVVMDEGWQAGERDADGRQQVNATRFPSSLSALADHVHGLGLKLGLYSYADWGVDYLEYDNCGGFHAGTHTQQERFQTISNALRSTGRNIFYSLCQWGHQFPCYWADQVGAGSYRMFGDIHARFSEDKAGVCATAYCLNTGYAGVSILTMIRKMREVSPFRTRSAGSRADMDMLEVGVGYKVGSEVAMMSEVEEQTHFSFCAALKSPLVIGADVTRIRESSLRILLNDDIIAISQEEREEAVRYLPDLSNEGAIQVWAGPIESGLFRHVVLALNYGENATIIKVHWGRLPGLEQCPGGGVRVKDVLAAKDLGVVEENILLRNVQIGQTNVLLLSC
ncbi:Alpha-galactosidase 2-like protein 2 [Colletotrichum chlorophyti]|uniref:Alpha-galactosidase n=1 Tax=Colletotrichum chlorophyti TaxID=708187 RepID=A0A1Q8S738_9PEZI|nr:Alpha-galactosidase 2-like protein 2 [Colletotrichum chlorophyti]